MVYAGMLREEYTSANSGGDYQRNKRAIEMRKEAHWQGEMGLSFYRTYYPAGESFAKNRGFSSLFTLSFHISLHYVTVLKTFFYQILFLLNRKTVFNNKFLSLGAYN